MRRRVTRFVFMAFSHSFLAPLVSPSVDEHSHQPRLFIRTSMRNCGRGTNSLEVGFLNEIERVINARNETSGEAIQPVPVRVEQRR